MNQLVSLISPCWNGELYLPAFLECVKEQTYRPLEFILVDDGSTDGTAEICKQLFPKLEEAGVHTVYIYQEHAGQATAVDRALRVFQGEYLAWADSDDYLHPDNISLKVEYLDNHPDIGLVRNNANHLQDGMLSEGIAKSDEKCDMDLFETLLLEKTYVYAGCYMMRRSLFFACYPEGRIPLSAVGQNLQLLLPAASRSICGYVDQVLMTYQIHSDSHAFRSRNLKEQYERIEGFRVLLQELEPYCAVDPLKYQKLVDEKCTKLKKRLMYMLALHHRSVKEP